MKYQKATSDKQSLRGVTILIALFLFMLLAIFALNMAQVISIDTKSITPNPLTGVTGKGPRKEFERLQVFYLAQAGLYHLRERIAKDPTMTDLSSICGSPTCTITMNDDETAPTGYYIASLSVSGTTDSAHTLLPDLLAISQGRTPSPPTAALRTNVQFQDRFWRSTRAYSFIPSDKYDALHPAVNLIDRDAPTTEGLDKNMGSRNWGTGDPPVGITGMDLGDYWACYDCNLWYEFVIDFGMEVTFDEIRWLNEYSAWVFNVSPQYWNDTTQSWVEMGEMADFPKPGEGGGGGTPGPVAPYDSSNCPNPKVYNGDRCTNFLSLDEGSEPTWGVLVGGNECIFSNACQNLVGSPSPTNPVFRSYIARYTVGTPVTTRRVRVKPIYDSALGGPGLKLKEVGFYCCAPTDSHSKQNVLKQTHGLARIGLIHNASNQIIYQNPNAARAQSEGVFSKTAPPAPNLE